MEILLVLIGFIILVIIATSINRSKRNNTSKRKRPGDRDDTDIGDGVDDTEDILMTGIILGGMLDNDNQDESDTVSGDDGGGFDDGGFDGGGFE